MTQPTSVFLAANVDRCIGVFPGLPVLRRGLCPPSDHCCYLSRHAAEIDRQLFEKVTLVLVSSKPADKLAVFGFNQQFFELRAQIVHVGTTRLWRPEVHNQIGLLCGLRAFVWFLDVPAPQALERHVIGIVRKSANRDHVHSAFGADWPVSECAFGLGLRHVAAPLDQAGALPNSQSPIKAEGER
jgi:hypothetical protein